MKRTARIVVVLGCIAGLGAIVAPSNAQPAHPAHPAKPAGFTAASHREPPKFPKGDYQARRLRVISIVPGGGTAASSRTQRLIWFGHALVRSPWYAAMNTAYGLGGSTGISGYVKANTGTLGHHPTNAQIAKFVNTVGHNAGIHRVPSVKTIWLVYFHSTTSSDTASKAVYDSADHESPGLPSGVANRVFGPLDSLGLVLVGTDQWANTSGAFSLTTRNAAHEVIEAATDRGGTGYRLTDTNLNKPWLGGSPWTEVQSGGGTEVGDQGRVYGTYTSFKFTDPSAPSHNYTYDYSRIFVNYAASLGGDPSRPASTAPYYNTSAKHDWYKLPKTGSKHVVIPMTAWSVKNEKDWTVTASVLGWNKASGGTAPCSKTASKLKKGTTTHSLTNGVVVNNGTAFNLDVHYTPGTSTWCVFEVKSHRTGNEPGGTGHTTTGDDLYRSWIVGVYTG